MLLGIPNKDDNGTMLANYRGIGLADMINSIQQDQQTRCSLDLSLHVLEVMEGILVSAESKKSYFTKTVCEKPQILTEEEIEKNIKNMLSLPTIEAFVGNTPLVKLQRIPKKSSNVILGKLEGNNPAGSVKDRPALSMIKHAEARGEIKPGDTLIEASSGNTGIALAMAAAIRGYRMILVMPENMSIEPVSYTHLTLPTILLV